MRGVCRDKIEKLFCYFVSCEMIIDVFLYILGKNGKKVDICVDGWCVVICLSFFCNDFGLGIKI